MRNCIALKFIALILCACCLLVTIAAGLGVLVMVELGLYNSTVEELREEQFQQDLDTLARQLANTAALQELGSLPAAYQEEYLLDHWGIPTAVAQSRYCYTITADGGRVIDNYYDRDKIRGASTHQITVVTTYPVVLGSEQHSSHATTYPSVPDATEATEEPNYGYVGTPSDRANYMYIEEWVSEEGDIWTNFRLGICRGPVYQVKLYVQPGDLILNEDFGWDVAEFFWGYRYDLIWIFAAALLLFAATFVYLCCAAGRKPGTDEVRPGGLNRLPLDLYGAATALAIYGIGVLCYELVWWWNFPSFEPFWLLLAGIAGLCFIGCLVAISFLFACVAQLKAPGFFWAKHSIIGLSLRLIFRVLRWVFRVLGKFLKWLFPNLRTALKTFFTELRSCILSVRNGTGALVGSVFRLIGRFFKWIFSLIKGFFRLLPLTWQWILVGLLMIFLLTISLRTYSEMLRLIGLGLCTAIVLYGAHCFGILLESTKRMSKGDLQTKVEDKFLWGSFREYADHLNALADVAMEAARRQMKSERMKAELVTNVSHDIKTPLTSIINYVDLLQNAQSQEEAASYLEVLDRQAQRLKKLIDDLMEMSKASTGNMTVDLQRVDMGETVTQALGEFSEKMEGSQITPVFQPPEKSVYATADGRLTWRVLSNLFSNAVKYAMPGTRLYIDLVETENRVQISLKNISAQPLNVSAEELLERFVRGDASRNTEGSGLGLNIAKSLMELQHGSLELLVDGDLFKVILSFPKETL